MRSRIKITRKKKVNKAKWQGYLLCGLGPESNLESSKPGRPSSTKKHNVEAFKAEKQYQQKKSINNPLVFVHYSPPKTRQKKKVQACFHQHLFEREGVSFGFSGLVVAKARPCGRYILVLKQKKEQSRHDRKESLSVYMTSMASAPRNCSKAPYCEAMSICCCSRTKSGPR